MLRHRSSAGSPTLGRQPWCTRSAPGCLAIDDPHRLGDIAPSRFVLLKACRCLHRLADGDRLPDRLAVLMRFPDCRVSSRLTRMRKANSNTRQHHCREWLDRLPHLQKRCHRFAQCGRSAIARHQGARAIAHSRLAALGRPTILSVGGRLFSDAAASAASVGADYARKGIAGSAIPIAELVRQNRQRQP